MAGNASAIFGGGGGVPIGAIVLGQFANDSTYLPLDGGDYVSATYPQLDKTNMKTFGSNQYVSRTLPSSATWNCVTYGNSQFVAMGASVCATSPDGITWTARTVAAVTFATVVYAGSQYVAGTTAGLIYTSPDAITWTSRGNITGFSITSIAYGAGLYVINGTSAATENTSHVYTSPDAVTWTVRSIAAGVNIAQVNVSFRNSKFYANYYSVNTGTTCYTLYTSADGITWWPISSQILGSTGTAVGINATASPVMFRNKLVHMGFATNTWVGDEGPGNWQNLPLPVQSSYMVNLDNIGAVATTSGSGTASAYPTFFSFDFRRWLGFVPTASGKYLIANNGIAASATRVVTLSQAAATSTCQTLDIDTTKFRMPLSTPTGFECSDSDRYYMKVA